MPSPLSGRGAEIGGRRVLKASENPVYVPASPTMSQVTAIAPPPGLMPRTASGQSFHSSQFGGSQYDGNGSQYGTNSQVSGFQPYAMQQFPASGGAVPLYPASYFLPANSIMPPAQFSRPVSNARASRDTWTSSPETTVVLTALHAFTAENEDEIDLVTGQRVTLVLQADEDWVVVKAADGRVGLVPLNHVTAAGMGSA